MALYAMNRVGDAIDMTKGYLTPFDRGRWGRLFVVIIFLLMGSGGGGISSTVSNAPSSIGSAQGEYAGDATMMWSDLSASVVALVVGVIVVLLLIWIALAAIGAIMEFVFVESLSRDEIHVRQYFRQYARTGLRLFGFRVVLGLLSLVIIGGAIALLFGDLIGSVLAGQAVDPSASRIIGGVIVLLPLFLVVGIIVGLINGFTTEFIVPIMLREDRGVIASWKRFWPTLTGQWKQYGVYAFVQFALHIVTSIAASVAMVSLLIILLIPGMIAGILLFVGVTAAGAGGPLVGALIVAAVGVFLLVLFVATTAVQIPIKVFHRQFALLVLGDTNEEFDVLGDRRPSMSE